MGSGFLARQLRGWSDHERSDSLARRLRLKRFAVFSALVGRLPRPVRILDIGGAEGFWVAMGLERLDGLEVTLLNLLVQSEGDPRFLKLTGDARSMPYFADCEFDVVFSNSVIEHLGGYEQQMRMAHEVQRVGKRYFLQTPSRWFPLEPHFLFPAFQFLPFSWRIWIASHYSGGWYCHPGDPQAARREVESIRLLTRRECRRLFPGSEILTERLFGLTKSYLIMGGWSVSGG